MNREHFILTHTAFKKLLGIALAIGAIGTASATPSAGFLGPQTPAITAGALPDSPGNRVDPNVASSRFSGVVSLQIVKNNEVYICTGTLVGKRSVVTAGHCVDTNGNGSVIDPNAPGSSVHAIFNATTTGPGRNAIKASAVSMHGDYAGFGKCPTGVSGFCTNDDVAVVTLAQDAPAEAKIYKIATTELVEGSRIVMAGYGTSGDGVNGFNVAPAWRVKRSGQNYIDLFAADDETNRTSGKEIWYADFDGNGIDSFCTRYGLCTPTLANDVESGIGGGDSGGPSFVEMYGELMLIATNTFTNAHGYKEGAFGSYFGGMVLKAYLDYINDATGGAAQFVPEPASTAVFGLGLLALAGARRRKQQK